MISSCGFHEGFMWVSSRFHVGFIKVSCGFHHDNSIQKRLFLPGTRDFRISLCRNPVSTSRTPDSPLCKKERKKKTSYTVAVQSGTKIGHGQKWLFNFFFKSEYMHLIGRSKKSLNSIAVSVLIRP